MSKQIAKNDPPFGAAKIDGKCFQYVSTGVGTPDATLEEGYEDCDDCQADSSNAPSGSDGQGSDSSVPAGSCSREYVWCDNPVVKIYLPCEEGRGNFIKSNITGACYQFNQETGNSPTSAWANYDDNYNSCANCKGNQKYRELLSCEPDIVISDDDYQAFGQPAHISYLGRCYFRVEDTTDPVTAAPVQGFNGRCDCINAVANYNLKWEVCEGKQGTGPAFAVKSWFFDPGGFIKLAGGCYQRWVDKCDAITCDGVTGGLDLETFPSCETCIPDTPQSDGNGSDNPGGGGEGPASQGESGAVSSEGAASSNGLISQATNCTVYQNCDDPNDEINVPEWQTTAPVIRVGGVGGTCYQADGKLYTDIFVSPVVEEFASCGACQSDSSVDSSALGDLALWLEGDSGYGDLSEYDVAIGNTNGVFTQYNLNGHRALSLNGVDALITADEAAYIFNQTNYEGFMVVKANSQATFEPAFSFNNFADNTSHNWLALRDSDASDISSSGGAGVEFVTRDTSNVAQVLNDDADVEDVAVLVHFRRIGNQLTLKVADRDEVSITLTDYKTNNDRLTIGALIRASNPTGTGFAPQDIYELKLYRAVLTATERSTEISGLNSKYAL